MLSSYDQTSGARNPPELPKNINILYSLFQEQVQRYTERMKELNVRPIKKVRRLEMYYGVFISVHR